MQKILEVTIIGGGMIVHDQILPSIYQLQRLGIVGEISIVDKNTAKCVIWLKNPILQQLFPNSPLRLIRIYRNLRQAISEIIRRSGRKYAPYNIVVVALPDQMHYKALKVALKYNQHILCVKPSC